MSGAGVCVFRPSMPRRCNGGNGTREGSTNCGGRGRNGFRLMTFGDLRPMKACPYNVISTADGTVD